MKNEFDCKQSDPACPACCCCRAAKKKRRFVSWDYWVVWIFFSFFSCWSVKRWIITFMFVCFFIFAVGKTLSAFFSYLFNLRWTIHLRRALRRCFAWLHFPQFMKKLPHSYSQGETFLKRKPCPKKKNILYHSSWSGVMGSARGTIDFFSGSRGKAFLMSYAFSFSSPPA